MKTTQSYAFLTILLISLLSNLFHETLRAQTTGAAATQKDTRSTTESPRTPQATDQARPQVNVNHAHQTYDSAIGYSVTAIAILVIIVVIVFFMFFQEGAGREKKRMAASIKTAYSLQNEHVKKKTEEQLVETDANFNKEVLVERIWQAFKQMQIALANQDMRPVRHFVSDGIYEQLSIGLKIQKASKISNQMKNIEIRNVRIALVESDGNFDKIHFLITAQAISNFVESETQKVVHGSNYREMFTQYWTFLRRRGTKSLEKPGLFENTCPNCNNPFESVNTSTCPKCKAIVNSGDYDWVLSRITQASEWKINPGRDIVGLKAIKEKDPTFNTQHINDKVAVMFYRHYAAQFFANSDYIAKLATSSFLESHQDDYKPLENGKHRFYADSTIVESEIVEIKLSSSQDANDMVRVKVKWMGHLEEKTVPSLIVPDATASQIYLQEFILVRNNEVESSGKNILTSSHCPACAAEEIVDANPTCENCGITLNDGSHDWVVSSIRPFTGYPDAKNKFESMEFRTKGVTQDDTSMSVFDSEALIACSAALMTVDGDIDEAEEELLNYFARLRRIPNTRLHAIVNSVKNGHYQVPGLEDIEDSREFLRCLIQMCLVDGKVTDQEMDFLQALVMKMGYTTWDIQSLIDQERKKMYKYSQEVIRSLQNLG